MRVLQVKNKPTKKAKFLLGFGIAITIIALSFSIFATWQQFLYWRTPVYRTAKPIEDALVKADAAKFCSTENTAFGWNDETPWYDAFYSLDASKDDARTTVESAIKSTHLTIADFRAVSNGEQYFSVDFGDESLGGVGIIEGRKLVKDDTFCGTEQSVTQASLVLRLRVATAPRQ